MIRSIKAVLLPHHHNNYRPHLIRKHGLGLSVGLILLIQVVYNFQVSGQFQVLSYATEMSSAGLLTATNQHRANNGLPGLKINASLASAAQSKANHMIANNYWAHVAPDGTTPWDFIASVGYSYLTAGENLAYGFATSAANVQGWMDSPSHRDNMLSSAYEEVGFGVANGANFQGGENTVVVAMYGDPVTSTAPPTPPPPAPVQQSVDQTPQFEPPAETAEQPPEEEPQPEEPEPEVPDNLSIPAVTIHGSGSPPSSEVTTNLEAIVNGTASWALYATSLILVSLASIYFYRHMIFLQRIIVRGEHVLHTHPLLEASLVYATVWLLLSAQYGAIK